MFLIISEYLWSIKPSEPTETRIPELAYCVWPRYRVITETDSAGQRALAASDSEHLGDHLGGFLISWGWLLNPQ
jgi:hypothetical protein